MTSANSPKQGSPDPSASNRPSVDLSRSFNLQAGWLVTMNGHLDVLRKHALIVIDGRIESCLPWQVALDNYPQLPLVDRRDCIVMPGLVNAHTHLAMNLLRGFADDRPLRQWLEQYIWPTEALHMSPAFVSAGSELALAESLLCGVTTVNDMYFYPDATADICRQAGMRAAVGLIVLDFPSAWAHNSDDYISRGLALHDQLAAEPLLHTAFAPHAPYTVSRDPLERIATLAAELDVPVHMHVHETAHEVQEFERLHGVRPLERLDEIGLLNSNLQAVHLTQLTDAEIARLAETGVNAIHCPESNLKLASGISPVGKMLQAGINIAVGTDGAASNNDLDLLGELRTASMLAKCLSDDASVLPAGQALRMVTIDAARAMGLAEETGSLEPGKSADCIVIEPGLGMLPMYDVMAQLVYTQSSQHVTDVWVAGRQLLQGRQLLTLDADKLRRSAHQWADRISGTTHTNTGTQRSGHEQEDT